MPRSDVNRTDLPTPRLTITPAKAGYPADGGELDLLVATGVDLPTEQVDRKPIALALVIDRSGSMSGEPLEAAKAAARSAIEMLLPTDWVSVIAYDEHVTVVAGLVQAGADRHALLGAVASLTPGGSTALFAGWAEGLSQVMSCPDDQAAARVVLLSDGMANVGISDPATIAADVAQAASHGVTSTAMGFGRSYDEALLRAMGDAGQGNYVFIEGESQVVEAFHHELSGLSALRGRNVSLEPSARLSLEGTAGHLAPCGAGVRLPDLVGGLERELAIKARFDAGAKDPVVALVWDDVLTGRVERLEVPLAIEPLSRSDFDRLPTNQEVVVHLALASIAESKLRVAEAFRSGRTQAATVLLNEIRANVSALPAGELRSAETRELDRLADLAQRNQPAFAARYSEKYARDTLRGASDEKRLAQFRMERELFAKKMALAGETVEPSHQTVTGAHGVGAASIAGHGQPARSAPVGERTFQGASGSVVVQVWRGDITDQAVDVLVNSTNRQLFGNAGVDGAVHRRGGPRLTQAARAIGSLEEGRAAFTPGFDLPARWVVHTAAAPWRGGADGELVVLHEAYRSAYALATRLGARTLAVPALGTGTYRVPAEAASRVAMNALGEALERGTPFAQVRFVILDADVAGAFARALAEGPEAGASLPN